MLLRNQACQLIYENNVTLKMTLNNKIFKQKPVIKLTRPI